MLSPYWTCCGTYKGVSLAWKYWDPAIKPLMADMTHILHRNN